MNDQENEIAALKIKCAQFDAFLLCVGGELQPDGSVRLSAQGYGDWTRRKGTLRTKEIYAENGHLQGQILGLQSLIKMTDEIMIQALGRERAEDVKQIAALKLQLATARKDSFQNRVAPWMQACFGPEISADKTERNHRFIEEALELVQACGCTKEEAHQLVDYVFNRSVGEPSQEVGGVMVTLAALCLAQGLDMHDAGETELARIWTKIEQIRAKQAAKPRNSPLPTIQQ